MTNQYCDIMGCHASAKWKCSCNYMGECLEEYLCDSHMSDVKKLHVSNVLKYDPMPAPTVQENTVTSREAGGDCCLALAR